jgi:predicted O-methyltransferase YrrM
VKRWPHFAGSLLSWTRLRLHAGLSLRPWLSYSAARRIAEILPPNAHALEIGSGQSTLWLARRCERLLSIEADKHWFDHLRGELARAGHHHVDLRYRWRAEEIADFSSVEDSSLDFILVDGGPRAEVLERSYCKLRPGGVLYVDNTDNPGISESCRADLIAHAARTGGKLEFFPDFSPGILHATEGVLWISPK